MRENHGLEIIQDIIEKEVSSSFKTEDGRFIGIKEQPICSRYKRKTLKDNEYWSPNPLAMPSKKEISKIIVQTVHKQRKKPSDIISENSND